VITRLSGSSTTHSYLRSCNPDVFLVELVRVTDTTRGLVKNKNPIRFLTDLKLHGFSRSYRVVASAHHRGSLRGGHWVTRLCTTTGWFEVDDLRKKHVATDPPGVSDESVVVILLVASDFRC